MMTGETTDDVTWEEAFAAATRHSEGAVAILDSILRNGGDKALQDAAMGNANDAACILQYLFMHDPRVCSEGERFAARLKALRSGGEINR